MWLIFVLQEGVTWDSFTLGVKVKETDFLFEYKLRLKDDEHSFLTSICVTLHDTPFSNNMILFLLHVTLS